MEFKELKRARTLWKDSVLAGPTREIPCGQDEPTLPVRVAKNAGFALSYPIADSAIYPTQTGY